CSLCQNRPHPIQTITRCSEECLEQNKRPCLWQGPFCDADVSSGGRTRYAHYMSMPPIPPMPPPPPWEWLSSFGSSATIASVVRISPATEAAFCRAQRATLVGSNTPISTRSPYWSEAAL